VVLACPYLLSLVCLSSLSCSVSGPSCSAAASVVGWGGLPPHTPAPRGCSTCCPTRPSPSHGFQGVRVQEGGAPEPVRTDGWVGARRGRSCMV
jgi:hypothetical protein